MPMRGSARRTVTSSRRLESRPRRDRAARIPSAGENEFVSTPPETARILPLWSGWSAIRSDRLYSLRIRIRAHRVTAALSSMTAIGSFTYAMKRALTPGQAWAHEAELARKRGVVDEDDRCRKASIGRRLRPPKRRGRAGRRRFRDDASVARLEEVLHRQRQNPASDQPMNYERALAFFRGQFGDAWHQGASPHGHARRALRHLGRYSSHPVPLGIPRAARDENAHRRSGLAGGRARAARVRGAVPPVLPSCSRLRAACAATARSFTVARGCLLDSVGRRPSLRRRERRRAPFRIAREGRLQRRASPQRGTRRASAENSFACRRWTRTGSARRRTRRRTGQIDVRLLPSQRTLGNWASRWSVGAVSCVAGPIRSKVDCGSARANASSRSKSTFDARKLPAKPSTGRGRSETSGERQQCDLPLPRSA